MERREEMRDGVKEGSKKEGKEGMNEKEEKEEKERGNK